MKKMFLAAIAAVLSGICTVVSGADSPAPKKPADPVWLTSMSQAQEAARNGKKVIFVDFTGSDWCPWCVKLHENVLDRAAFKKFAADHLVLVYVDFPKNAKADDPAANEKLARKYKVEGFPTALVMSPDGKVVREIGGAMPEKEYLKELAKALPRTAGK